MYLSKKRIFTSLLILTLALGSISATRAVLVDRDTYAEGDIQPQRIHEETLEEILRKLRGHYRDVKLDDEMSAMVLDKYLEHLDPNRVYFLESDINEFNRNREKLDNELKDGELTTGFRIFNVYQKRAEQRLTHLLGLIDKGTEQLSFDDDEAIRIDRSEAPWPADEDAMNDLWRQRLENAVLTRRLKGEDDKDILERLERRYSSQLKRIRQNTAEDAFQLYINALTLVVDPHTNYLTPHGSENFNISMSRSLEGIGAVLQAEDEHTKVVRLVPAGPADKAGELRPADTIVGVAQGDDEIVNVIGWRLQEVVNLIRGPKGSVVRLEIIPAGAANEHDTRIISITRNRVVLEEQAAKKYVLELPSSSSDKPAYKVGIIELPAFYIDFDAYHRGDPEYTSTTRDVAQLLMELREEDVDGLIIDLRNNGGGSLEEATKLVSLFIDRGPTVQIKEASGRVTVMPDRYPGVLYNGPMGVLVNRFSASASEIFAGAMQDYGRALIIGDQTFGKGTVQTLLSLDHGQLKMTQAKFYRVSGSSNQNQGIIPDVSMPFSVDKEEIGESTLAHAMPWDQIDSASYEPLFNLNPFIEQLKTLHQQRIDNDPEFIYIREQLEFTRETNAKDSITLNREAREQYEATRESRVLSIENHKRQALGEEPYKSFKALTQAQELERAEAPPEKDPQKDPWLVESGHILTDFISLYRETRVAASNATSQ